MGLFSRFVPRNSGVSDLALFFSEAFPEQFASSLPAPLEAGRRKRRESRADSRPAGTEKEGDPKTRVLSPVAFIPSPDTLGAGFELIRLYLYAESASVFMLVQTGVRDQAIVLARTIVAQAALDHAEGGEPAFLLIRESLRPEILSALVEAVEAGRTYILGSVRLLIEEGLARSLESALRNRGGALPHPPNGGEPSEKPGDSSRERALALGVDRPASIMVTRLLLPARFLVGDIETRLYWKSLSGYEESGSESGEDSGSEDGAPTAERGRYWLASSSRRPGGRVYFCLWPPAGAGGEFASRAAALLEAGLAKTLGSREEFSAAERAELSRLVPLASLPGEAFPASIFLRGELRAGSGGFPFGLLLPRSFLKGLVAFTGIEVEAVHGPRSLALFLAAEGVLRARWAEGHCRSYLAPRAPRGASRPSAFPSLAALFGLLGPRDAGLLVQNCLVPQLGPRALPSLFYRQITTGEGRRRLLPLEPFPEERLLALLPPVAKEEWENEIATGLGEKGWGADMAIAANEAALRRIYGMMKGGRLDLSVACRSILERELGARIVAENKARLDAAIARGIPFRRLDSLPRGEVPFILGALSNRDLALGVLGEEERIPFLRRALGPGRGKTFDEEVEFARERFARGEVSTEDVIETKEGLAARIEALLAARTGEKTARDRPFNNEGGFHECIHHG